MKINLKKEKGFTIIDVTIAMLVVALFAAIMSSMLYSVYSSSTEAKRTAVALNYAVDIFENIGLATYDDVYSDVILHTLQTVNVTNVSGTGNEANGKIGTYDINLKVEDKYGDSKVKLITLTITYPVSAKKTETMQLQRIKAKTA